MSPGPLLVLCLLGAALFIHADLALATAASHELAIVVGSADAVSTAFRRRRGRPRKFAAPSRAVTLTLPESVIAALSRIHDDLGRAIVGLIQQQAPSQSSAPAELLVFEGRAVISIRTTPSLERRAGLHLVPLPNGRALISFDTPKTLAEVELTLADALEDPTLTREDRAVFEGILAILKDARRSKRVSLVRQHIIVLEDARAARTQWKLRAARKG